MTPGKVGGLIVRIDGALAFLSGSVAVEVAPLPQITRVPGAPENLLGIALHEDELVPVVAVGELREAMILCTHIGEKVGLVGGHVVGAGVFEADGTDAVTFGGERVSTLDVAGILGGVRGGGWGGRWGG